MQVHDHFHSFHAFDYVPDTWRFIRDRFARQAKALKKLTGLKTAQCYDLIAAVGEYAGWRQMSQTMDVLEAIERYSEDLFYAEERTETPKGMRTALAAVNALGSEEARFCLNVEGQLPGFTVTAILADADLAKAPRVLDEDVLLSGLDVFAEIRFTICAQATWVGHTHIMSIATLNTLEQASVALEKALGSEALADDAVEAMYGVRYGETLAWNPDLEVEFQLLDHVARQVLAGRPTTMSPPLAEAYRQADEGAWATVATWRARLQEAAPHSLDITSENGPLTALVLNNAPADALIWIRLAELEIEGTPRAHYFVTDGQIWVPTAEQVGAAAACSGSPPQHTQAVTPEVAESYHLPVRTGYLLTWD